MKKTIALGFMAALLTAAFAQDKMDNPNDKMSHDKMADSKGTKKKKSGKSTSKMDDTKKSADKMDKM